MWAGSDSIPKKKQVSFKLHPILLGAFIVVAVALVLYDLSLGDFLIRPDKAGEVQLYASLTHLVAIVGVGFLIHQLVTRAEDIGARVLGLVATIGIAGCLLFFWMKFLISSSSFPMKTYQFEEYDRAYFVYKQTALFRRDGCSVYESTGKYTMQYVGGSFAVSLDTAYVSNDTFNISFRGADKILMGRKPDHWFEADLVGGYSYFY